MEEHKQGKSSKAVETRVKLNEKKPPTNFNGENEDLIDQILYQPNERKVN